MGPKALGPALNNEIVAIEAHEHRKFTWATGVPGCQQLKNNKKNIVQDCAEHLPQPEPVTLLIVTPDCIPLPVYVVGHEHV